MIKKIQISEGMWKFAKKVMKTWGLKQWKGIKDPDEVLFFGMYSDNDYEVIRHFTGKKSIFWLGSDITQMLANPDRIRVIKLFPDIQHYTETEREGNELKSVGLKVIVSPSFLEYVKDFPVCYKPSETPHIYLSGHPNREEEYGFDLCKKIAKDLPEFTFHFYGVEGKSYDNIVYHGWVENEQFNKEIRNYQCGLRPNKHDGCSEIILKSILMGQYPISFLPYEGGVWDFKTESELIVLLRQLQKPPASEEPNLQGRDYWIKKVNDYSWLKDGR